MPLVKKKISVAAGAVSDQILAGTTYEYVDPGTRIVVAAAVDTAGSATADTTMTLPSTMPNLARMRQYRASLLENRLDGMAITL